MKISTSEERGSNPFDPCARIFILELWIQRKEETVILEKRIHSVCAVKVLKPHYFKYVII